MSKIETDRDGFQIVKSKSKRISRNKPTKIPTQIEQFHKEDINVNIEKTTSQIKAAFEELRISDYFKDFITTVSTVLKDRNVLEIICLGLGHIAECNISKYQLAFLLCLKELCDNCRVLVHDPVFYKDECEVLKCLGLTVIPENSEGSYIISDKHTTVAYFPHCPKQLTNNFLWSNWGIKLHNLLLICNSFNSLIDNNPSRLLEETVPYIFRLHQFTKEVIIENSFKFTDIFNDTSLHYFDRSDLENLEKEFWNQSDKPVYDNSEEFITSLMVQNLNI